MLPRTRLIVRDLSRLLERAENLEGLTIRIAAGMSSLAISDDELAGRGDDDREYFAELIQERNALLAVLLRGARVKAVLNPPRRFARAMLPRYQRMRYERLIALLEGPCGGTRGPAGADDVRALTRCEIVLSPVPVPNTFIIGEVVAYEGMKRGGGGGFEVTHCEVHPLAVHELIAAFDHFFDDSRREMLRLHPPDGRLIEQLRQFYDEATAAGPEE